jgi:hypothetical protein
MSLIDIVKNVSPDKIVEAVRPFIPEQWKNVFSGYGTYAIGALMILSGGVSILGVPLPWVPFGTEGQWIAGGFAAFTVRRAIANKEKNILAAIKENTEITKTIADSTAAPTPPIV